MLNSSKQDFNLTFRRASFEDLESIILLLLQDELGKNREESSNKINNKYVKAFNQIVNDENQYLMVAILDSEVIGTCHLTLIPSLTFTGKMRMQIEAVRINENFRSQNFGKKMIEFAINWGKKQGAEIIQLTTNKQRLKAKKFYETMGFEATHEGMKKFL